MKKILVVLTLLMLAGCTRQVLPNEVDPQIQKPSSAPERFIDTEYSVVCYWHYRDAISCVKV